MKFRLSGEYGELSPVRNWEPHTGIDLAIPENTTLRAIGEGVVDRIYDGSGAIGKGLSIRFDDGSRAIYGHMNDVNVKVGEHVNAGDVLGLSGSTGHSTAPHLHFGLKDSNGQFTDPTFLAEPLANISGNSPDLGILGKLLVKGTGTVSDQASDLTKEILLGVADGIKDLFLNATLIGAAILILLRVAGWKDGGRWAGTILVANVLIKFLFGVY